MKILHVRFKNLNSLVGEWEIDLAHPAFASEGLFAITGPTGAGKTTILDAICLALYGATPRLNKITKSENEIMSRQTGECFAEVTFETQKGRYRCHWSQRRARKKADGELQAPKHELADAHSGEIFESKLKSVAKEIEAATGMDFDRFTRSMLLAQGGFAVFLQAEADERAPLLEQITGTEIYSKVSIRVHEREREERKKLELLEAETAGIALLHPEEERGLEELLEEEEKRERGLADTLAGAEKEVAWLKALEGLQEELVELAEEARQLEEELELFKPCREQLERALKAASLEGAFAALQEIRKLQSEDKEALKAEEAALPELASAAERESDVLKRLEEQAVKLKKELSSAAPLLQRVRYLDQKLADQKKALLEGEESCAREALKIKAHRQARSARERQHDEAQRECRLANGYLEEHARDEWLISGLAAVEEQFDELRARKKEIEQKEAEEKKALTLFEQAQTALEESRNGCILSQQRLGQAEKKLQAGQEALGRLLGDRLLREYRFEKEALLREMAFRAKIAKLKEHRSKLKEGTPCPLCGATEHPFAEGKLPSLDEVEKRLESLAELIRQAEAQESVIEQLKEAEKAARKSLNDAEKREMLAAGAAREAERARDQAREALKRLHADFSGRREALSAKLLPLGIQAFDDPALQASLRERQRAWQSCLKKKSEAEKLLAECQSEMRRLEALIEAQSCSLAEKSESLEALRTQERAERGERAALYGDKDPDEEELRLTRALEEGEAAEKQARERHQELLQQAQAAKTRAEALKKRLEQKEPELEALELEFSKKLEPLGFLTEEQLREARLPEEQRGELAAKAEELKGRQAELAARHKDRKARLEAEKAKKLSDQPLHELERRLKEGHAVLKELLESIACRRQRLKENRTAKERIEEKQACIEAQKRVCSRWKNLHELIGSSDGKKYRNFAQGLTFEIMIGHANRQLQKMTDRYLLIRNEKKPLELSVVDSYQAGEIRSTKNLSGGESFLISLSLALGLSNMAGKEVRVDSLFLDEGFGTLDEKALDTALGTLASLQQEGKLIGVISHVPALKERIGTQIHVATQAGGRSQLSGPGCGRPP